MFVLTSDPTIKGYFEDKVFFADFINGTSYKGKQVLSASAIHDYPTDITDIIDFHDKVESIVDIRDLVAKVTSKGTYKTISKQLKKKVGSLSEEIIIQIQNSTTEMLNQLTDEIFD